METRVSSISKVCVVWLSLALAVWLVITGVATSALAQTAEAPVKIAALDPRGVRPPIQRTPLSPRLQNMSKSTVNILDTRDGSGLIYERLKAELEKRYPGVKVVTIATPISLARP